MDSKGCYLVSWDFTNGKDETVVLVGVQKDNQVTVVNGFQGKDAEEIIQKLSTSSNQWKGYN